MMTSGGKKPYCQILVVDDEPLLRETISVVLTRCGYLVLTAESGRKALELLNNNKVDLVISDIRMPDGDGIFLLKSIRESSGKGPEVVFITGFSDVTEESCLKLGARAVIQKPFDRKVLIAAVEDALKHVIE